MNELFDFNTLLPYGKVVGGVLEIADGFSLEVKGEASMECLKVTCLSCFCGEAAPHIAFSLTASGQAEPFYKSHVYNMGKKGEYTLQSWRVPPTFLPNMTLTVTVNVPEGTVLKVRNFAAERTATANIWNGGLRHNAHLGFWGLAPDNTMPAFELAAACGFPACIVVPKVTKDGVLVCIHDDTINRTARGRDGNAPTEELRVDALTYEQLLEWDFGLYKNEIYKGTKIPLLDDFFALCARTGMRPMFSTHPALTVEQWHQVKEMLIRHGLLKRFHIKSFSIDVLKTAYSIFGTGIDGYTYDNSIFNEERLENLKSVGFDTAKCRVGFEFKFREYTEEIARQIISEGYFAAAWSIGRTTADQYNRLISYGVTEFTEDYHCSMGFNW